MEYKKECSHKPGKARSTLEISQLHYKKIGEISQMADEKKYEISTSELKKYICLAMNEVMPKGVTLEEQEKFVEFAADIEIRIEAHLNGEKPFKSRDVKDYELVSIVMDSLNELCNLISKREGE